VLVHGLARHEQVHDFAGALEDACDAHVAHEALDGHRAIAAGDHRGLGLVAAPAADLHDVVRDFPGARRVPLLGGGGLEARVEFVGVGHAAGQQDDGFHGEGLRGDVADHERDGLVIPEALAPLLAFVRPDPRDFEEFLGAAHGAIGHAKAAGIQGGEGDA
jgi:hypothetical protein